MLLPKIVQIETVATACTARCIMCPIETWTRPVAIMKLDFFSLITQKLAPYVNSIDYTVLHGCGEPLLDKTIAAKIALARKIGLRGIHFATNATELTEKNSCDLLESGIHRVIFSLDGITKQTHEAIRRRTNYDEIVEHVHRFIAMRDAGGYDTQIWIRMIRQKLNNHEWPEYEAYWSRHLTSAKHDRVVYSYVHNWGDDDNLDDIRVIKPPTEPVTWCQDLWQRVHIHCSGAMALCCADDNGWYEIGNVKDGDPVEIFNTSPVFQRHRDLMSSGRIRELEHCRNCSIPFARENTNYHQRSEGRIALPAAPDKEESAARH